MPVNRVLLLLCSFSAVQSQLRTESEEMRRSVTWWRRYFVRYSPGGL